MSDIINPLVNLIKRMRKWNLMTYRIIIVASFRVYRVFYDSSDVAFFRVISESAYKKQKNIPIMLEIKKL